jgi:predicted nucleic acid-binding protein
MSLNKIPSGDVTVIDANIIIYAMQKASLECKRLLARCAEEDVTGILPLHVLSEVMHQVMIAEARDNGWIKGPNPAKQLSEQPDKVRRLVRYEGIVRDVLGIGLVAEPLQREDFISALKVQRDTGLLTNDALIVAVAQRLRANSISSADRSFGKVQGMLHYAPDDVET